MAVTKPVRTAMLLFSMAVLLLGYQNCAVSLSGETPGASTFSCNPDTATLNQFAQIEASLLVSRTGNHCGACHDSTFVGPMNGWGQYSILANSTPSSTSPITLANYCTAARRGASELGIVFTNAHAGGNFTPDLASPEFADFQTFIQNNF